MMIVLERHMEKMWTVFGITGALLKHRPPRIPSHPSGEYRPKRHGRIQNVA